jgi:hypothetical protein
MPNKLKVGDAVFFGEPPLSWFVEDVDYEAKTADIRSTAGAVVTHQNVAWSELIQQSNCTRARTLLGS